MPSTSALKIMMQSATSDQSKITRKADHSGYVTPLGVMPPVTTILARPLLRIPSTRRLEASHPVEYQKTGLNVAPGFTQPVSTITTPANGRTTLAHGGYLRSMIPWIEANVVEPVLMEAPIYHPKGFSGTFDNLCFCAEWPELTLLDYKTSKRSKIANPTYLENYWDQLGAYSLGLQHTYDIKPQKGVLCIGRPNRPS